MLPEGDWLERLSSTPAGVWTEVKADENRLRKQAKRANRSRERNRTAIIEEKNWRLNPARFSKWYRVSSNGQLEFGQSLVRVRGWVKRLIKNC